MSLYNGPIELLKAAANKGIINIGGINIRIGGIDVTTPGAVNILKPTEWKLFLQDIIDTTDDLQERQFAQTFLLSIQHIETVINTQIKEQGEIIDENTINTFSKALDKCESFDDVLNLIEANVKRLPITQSQRNNQEHISNILQINSLHWKKPIKFNNTYRYYSHEIDWFIQRQESRSPKGRVIYYYSIFTPQEREVARYDRLKDAKNNILEIIKKLISN